jgi:hypothetical protein
VALVVGLGLCGFGAFGVMIGGFCDTSCPSDRALAIYHVLRAGGAVIALASALSLIVLAARKRGSRSANDPR